MLSCGGECYQVGPSSIGGSICYHVRANVIMWEQLLSSGKNCISGIICCHVRANVIMWEQILSSGRKYYHVGANVIKWDQVVLVEAYVIM